MAKGRRRIAESYQWVVKAIEYGIRTIACRNTSTAARGTSRGGQKDCEESINCFMEKALPQPLQTGKTLNLESTAEEVFPRYKEYVTQLDAASAAQGIVRKGHWVRKHL